MSRYPTLPNQLFLSGKFIGSVNLTAIKVRW